MTIFNVAGQKFDSIYATKLWDFLRFPHFCESLKWDMLSRFTFPEPLPVRGDEEISNLDGNFEKSNQSEKLEKIVLQNWAIYTGKSFQDSPFLQNFFCLEIWDLVKKIPFKNHDEIYEGCLWKKENAKKKIKKIQTIFRRFLVFSSFFSS